MNDLKFIKKHPRKFNDAMMSRGEISNSTDLLAMDSALSMSVTELHGLQGQKNILNKKFTDKSISMEERQRIISHSKELEESINLVKFQVEKHKEKLDTALLNIPNIPEDDIPIGKDDNENLEIAKYGTQKKFSFPIKSHDILGENLGVLDFKQTAKFSGARFSTLKGKLAKLGRALMNLFLQHNADNGYLECSTPYLVKDSAMYGAGQLPKFTDDSFRVEDKFRLIPTGEVTLANLVADTILNEEDLPMRLTTYSECFRSEAGSAGKDTRGIIRQHQFGKVELFSIVMEEDSVEELELITQITEKLLIKLDLPYRKMLLCTGDIGFCSQKTYDLEVWMPSQNCYREISSCSNCGSFQARRLKARYKSSTGNKFVHTLNGSSLPIGRALVAIMENYQNADGSITIPEILRSETNFNFID